MGMVNSPCGAADLLAAIYEEPREQVRAKLGLPPVPSPYIDVACSWCSQLTKRRATGVVYVVSQRGQEHFFCNRSCQGKWVAVGYTSGRYPKRRRAPPHFDREMVWAKHLETGYGAVRLARLLGMKTVTVEKILQKKRKEATHEL